MPTCVCDPPTKQGYPYLEWVGIAFGDCVYTPAERASFFLGMISLALFFVAFFPQIRANYGTIFTHQLPTQIYVGAYFLLVGLVIIAQYFYYSRQRRSEDVVIQEPLLQDPTRTTNHSQTISTLSPRHATSSSSLRSQPLRSSIVATTLLCSFVAACSAYSVPQVRSLAISSLAIQDDMRLCNQLPELSTGMVILGDIMAWSSGLLYFLSRIPQILQNRRKRSVEGLSISLFIIALLANVCYGLGVILRFPKLDAHFFAATFPYLLGSIGTILFDAIIISQSFWYAKSRSENDDTNSKLNKKNDDESRSLKSVEDEDL